MSGRVKRFFKRINSQWPWLKFAVVILLAILIVVEIVQVNIRKYNAVEVQEILAPMQNQVETPNRFINDLEGKKLVALTFDDGPSAETTPKLLEILKEQNVPATFFMLGSRASNNPDIVLRAAKDGHEIASHTMWHQNLGKLKAAAIIEDRDAANAVFEQILGEKPTLVRPPYGSISNLVRENIGAPMILWTVDTLDWKYKNTESILAATTDEVFDGAIILMHDIHPTSVEAVPELIKMLREDGYEFVTVSELAQERKVTLVEGESYGSFRAE